MRSDLFVSSISDDYDSAFQKLGSSGDLRFLSELVLQNSDKRNIVLRYVVSRNIRNG